MQTTQEPEVDRRTLYRLRAMQDSLKVDCGRGRPVNFLARASMTPHGVRASRTCRTHPSPACTAAW